MKLNIYAIIIGILFVLSLFLNLDFFIEKEVLSKWYVYSIITWLLFIILLVTKTVLIFKFDNITICLIILASYITTRELTSNIVNISIINLLTFIVLFIIFKNISRKIKHIDTFIVLACLMQAIYGLLQFFGIIYAKNELGIMGSFNNPAGFAACLAIGFPFALNSLDKTDKNKCLERIGVVIIGLAIIFSKSRTGVLVITIVSLLYLYNKHEWLRSRKITTFILFAIVFAVIIVFLFLLNQNSANGRLFIWQNSVSMIKDNLFFGNGLNYFNKCYMLHQAVFFNQNPHSIYSMIADNVFHPFNEYLLFTIGYGMAGVFILLATLFALKKNIKITNHKYLLPLIGIGVFCCFSYPLKYPFVIIIIAYCLSQISVQAYSYYDLMLIRLFRIPLFIIAVLILSLLYHDIHFEIKWKELVRLSSLGKIEQTIGGYSTLKEQWNNNTLFLYNYGALLFRLHKYSDSLNELKECEKYYNDYDVQLLIADNYSELNIDNLAEKHYLMAHNMIPNRFVPLLKLLHLYIKNDDHIQATKVANKIVNKKVKVPSVTVSQIIDEAKYYLRFEAGHQI